MLNKKLVIMLLFLIIPLFLTSSNNISYQTEENPPGMSAETWEEIPIPGDEYDFRAYYKSSISAEIVFPEDFYDWSYRKKHTILPAAGAGTNYQVKLCVHYVVGEDLSGSVFLDNFCQVDFDDIRFTSSDGKTELDYWIEEVHPAENATIWVEIKADLNASDQIIYLYYGNSEVSTSSSGTDTFLFFDDFNTNNWNYSGTTITINSAEGRMYWKCTSLSGYAYYDLGSTYQNFALETCGQRINTAPFGNLHIGLVDTPTTYHDYNDAVIQHFNYASTNQQAARLYYGGSDTTLYGIPDETAGLDYRWQLLYNASYVTVRNLDLNQYTNVTGTILTTLDNLLVCTRERDNNAGFFNWMLLRKYVYPEPTLGDWEFQETSIEPSTTTKPTTTASSEITSSYETISSATMTGTGKITIVSTGFSLPTLIFFVICAYILYRKMKN